MVHILYTSRDSTSLDQAVTTGEELSLEPEEFNQGSSHIEISTTENASYLKRRRSERYEDTLYSHIGGVHSFVLIIWPCYIWALDFHQNFLYCFAHLRIAITLNSERACLCLFMDEC